MPKVYNKHDINVPANSIYVGRGSVYGNPFVIGKDGNRNQVIAKYKAYINNNPDLISSVKKNLHGKNLVCFCAPMPCHGDILLEIANAIN